MIPMKENQASALTIVADRPTKRKNRYACKIGAIGQKVCVKTDITVDISIVMSV